MHLALYANPRSRPSLLFLLPPFLLIAMEPLHPPRSSAKAHLSKSLGEGRAGYESSLCWLLNWLPANATTNPRRQLTPEKMANFGSEI